MSTRKWNSVAVLLGIATSAILYLSLKERQAVAGSVSLQDGLPVQFTLVEDWDVPGGHHFRYRSAPLALAADDSPALMNDPSYLGHMGKHGSVTWIYVPSGYTITLFQNHLEPGVAPVLPPWWGDMLAYQASHPSVRIVSQDDEAGYVIPGGKRIAEKSFLAVPPPPPGSSCDPATIVSNPSVIDYVAVIEGDISDAAIPSQVTGIIYRVPNPVQ